MAQELGATATFGQLVHENTAGEGVDLVDVERHRHLEHARPTRGVRGRGDVRGGTAAECRSDPQLPTFRQPGDHVREVTKPPSAGGTVRHRPLADELRNVVHDPLGPQLASSWK
jgi:hypothetical protein